MELMTASGIINFVEAIETDSAAFYESAALRYSSCANIFLLFAKENRKNVQSVKRAYYSVISDALEACFSFGTISTLPYELNTELDQKMTLQEVLEKGVKIETAIQGFYKIAGEYVESHIEDIARIFKRLARTHDVRKSKLQELS
jgi:hypothetical protein